MRAVAFALLILILIFSRAAFAEPPVATPTLAEAVCEELTLHPSMGGDPAALRETLKALENRQHLARISHQVSSRGGGDGRLVGRVEDRAGPPQPAKPVGDPDGHLGSPIDFVDWGGLNGTLSPGGPPLARSEAARRPDPSPQQKAGEKCGLALASEAGRNLGTPLEYRTCLATLERTLEAGEVLLGAMRVSKHTAPESVAEATAEPISVDLPGIGPVSVATPAPDRTDTVGEAHERQVHYHEAWNAFIDRSLPGILAMTRCVNTPIPR